MVQRITQFEHDLMERANQPIKVLAHSSNYMAGGTTYIPNSFFDKIAPDLSDCELRLALYIMRRTYGFGKETDSISLSQFIHGITTSEGKVLDSGTGLSKPSVIRGLKGLVEKGVVRQFKGSKRGKATEISVYEMCFDNTGNLKQHNGYSPDEYSINEIAISGFDSNISIPMSQPFNPENNIKVQPDYPNNNYGLDFIQATGNIALPADGSCSKEVLPQGSKNNTNTGKNKVTNKQKTVKEFDPQLKSIQNKGLQNNNNNTVVGTLALHNQINSETDISICKQLQSFGLNREIAEKLASAYAPEYIQQKIALFERWLDKTGNSASRSVGYLRRAIEQDYQDNSLPVNQPKTFAAALAYLEGNAATAPVYEPTVIAPQVQRVSRYRKHTENTLNSTSNSKKADSKRMLPATTSNPNGKRMLPVSSYADDSIGQTASAVGSSQSGKEMLPGQNGKNSKTNLPSDETATGKEMLPLNNRNRPGQIDLERIWENAKRDAFDRFGLLHLQGALEGSKLEVAGVDSDGEYQLVLWTVEVWQGRAIRPGDLQTIRMAVRSSLGERCALTLGQPN